MSWKDDFKKSFDLTYELVNEKVWNLKYPCYGIIPESLDLHIFIANQPQIN